MIRFKRMSVLAALALPLAAGAACVKVEKNGTLPATPTGAAKLVLWLDEGAGSVVATLPTQLIVNNNSSFGEADVSAVVKGVDAQKAKRKQLRLVFVDSANKPLPDADKLTFVLPALDPAADVAACVPAKVAAAGGSTAVADAAVVPPADGDVCSRLARETPIAANERWVLFNSKGSLCATNYPLRQGDTLLFGLALRKGESPPLEFSVDPSGCTTPTGAVVVVGTLPTGFQPQSGTTGRGSGLPGVAKDEIRRVGAPLECASDEVKFTAKVDAVQGAENKLVLFPRVTALLHVGVLNSKLRDPDYGLRAAAGGGNVITDKQAQERGPEYVAMLVVQGLPHYLRQGYAYQGRDLVHDNGYADRVGLALAFGLKDPGKRFGLGLTFEVTRGVNLVAMHEWVKRSKLDELTVGGSFAGTASEIPTRQEWAKGWSFGLSLDSAFISAAFSGKK